MSPRSLRWFAVLVGGLLALSLLPIGLLRSGQTAEAQIYNAPRVFRSFSSW